MAEPLENRLLMTVVPVGGPIALNTYTTSFQEANDIAVAPDGSFVATWTSIGQDGSGSGVYARQYDATGAPQGSEFRINTYTLDSQKGAHIAMDSAGNFTIVWSSFGQGGTGDALYARRYNASGSPLGTEFLINPQAAHNQTGVDIAMASTGDFVLAWFSDDPFGASYDVYARRYDAAGNPKGNEVQVNTISNGGNYYPTVATNDAGQFVVGWETFFRDGSGATVFARRFDATGAAVGSDFQVNSYTTSDQRDPDVAMDSSGAFVFVWDSVGEDGDGYGVYGQRYTAAGAKTGSEFRINTQSIGRQQDGAIVMQPGGGFVVSYADTNGLFVRRYNSLGASLSQEWQIDSSEHYVRSESRIAINSAGDFVVEWENSFADGSDTSVFAARFHAVRSNEAATVGDFVWSDQDVDGIQDQGEAGISGITVFLWTSNDFLADSVRTDASGHYALQVPAGQSFYLQVTLTSGRLASPQNQGSDDAADSDISRTTFRTDPFVLANAGDVNNSFDAGLYFPASVSGLCFHDHNGNGIRDAQDEFLEGYVVFADSDGDGIRDPDESSATISSTGTYSLTGITPGAAVITVIAQSGWIPQSRSMTLAGGAVITGINFAMVTDAADSAGAPSGSEFRVNTYTTLAQAAPKVAQDADGNFVVAWQSSGQDGSGYGIYAQRYASSGSPIGSEFRVNTYTTSDQKVPAVAMGADGQFVIVWQSTNQDGSGNGIYAQQFAADGTRVGSEFQVNTVTSGAQSVPVVAEFNSGFVVSWTSSDGSSTGIFARRYNLNGSAQGTEFLVNTYTTNAQSLPAIAADTNGDLIITWQSSGQDQSGYGIYAQRFDASGTPLGAELQVNKLTLVSQLSPAVAMDDEGDFVVAWHTYAIEVGDFGIETQRFSSKGVAEGPELHVNTYTTGAQANASVAFDRERGFVISWSGPGTSDTGGIFARRYSTAGISEGDVFRINTLTTNTQSAANIVVTPDGDVTAVWQSLSQDGNNLGVYAQKYSLFSLPLVVNQAFQWQQSSPSVQFVLNQAFGSVLSSGNLLLENLTAGTTVLTSNVLAAWDPLTMTATFSFPNLPNGGALADGRYRATFIPPNAPAAGDQSFDFFFMNGDANHDAVVDVDDLLILATHWMQPSGGAFSSGDFNYDGTVDGKDLGILSVRWQTSLPSLSLLSTAISPTGVSSAAVRAAPRAPARPEVSDVSELVSQAAPVPAPTPAPAPATSRAVSRVAAR